MRSFELIVASAFVAAGAWVANAGGTTGIEIDYMITGAAGPSSKSYVMRAVGPASVSCTVDKGPTAADGLAPVTVHTGCEDVLPNVERVRYWRESADGSVDLVNERSESVVEFGIGDGVEFESYRPVSPLLSLSSRI